MDFESLDLVYARYDYTKPIFLYKDEVFSVD
jgi:hypothetical protein